MGEGRSRSRKEQEAEEQQQQQWQLRDLVGAVAAAVAAVGCRSQVRGGASNANSPEQPISQEQPSSYLAQLSLHKQEKRQVAQAQSDSCCCSVAERMPVLRLSQLKAKRGRASHSPEWPPPPPNRSRRLGLCRVREPPRTGVAGGGGDKKRSCTV